MYFKQILTELENIPITQAKKSFSDDYKGSVKRDDEPIERVPKTFNINDYKIKTKLTSSVNADKIIDKFEDTQMAIIIKYVGDDKAYVAYYERDVSKLDKKQQNALRKKMDEFGKKYSETKDETPKVKSSTMVNNITKLLDELSDESLEDLHGLALDLKRRDNRVSKKSR